MTEGRLGGGPRPGAKPERSLQVGFYASTLNERELEDLLEENRIRSEIVTFMEEELNAQTSSQDISKLSTAIKIEYNSAILKLFSETESTKNRVSLIKEFFEGLTGGTVRDINFESR